MSPASKSKSKDKSAAKTVKGKKPSSKPTEILVNGSNNVTSSACDPISGTFHTIETDPSSTNFTQTPHAPHSNGRFCNLTHESEEYIPDRATEYDSMSNNDSCSVDSEDHQKDKTNSNTNNASPMPISDADKREKTRLKNEKKHQRQRERKAQELHEKCCGYLTSRKLESLSQTLVAMGFTSEAATMALIHNGGRVEDSALWILEGGTESKQSPLPNLDQASVKIGIKDELSKIVEFKSKFKCSTQEIEKAVVACEGDLQKTAECLKAQLKQRDPAAIENDEQPTIANGLHYSSSNNMKKPSSGSNARAQPVKLLSNSLPIQLHRRDRRDYNYTKPSPTTTAETYSPASMPTEYPSLRKAEPTTSATTDDNSYNIKSEWIKAKAIHLVQRPQSSNGGRQYDRYYGDMNGANAARPSSIAAASSSLVGWSRNNMSYCDYTRVDWSLDSTPLERPSSMIKGERLYDNALHVRLMADYHAVGMMEGAGSGERASSILERDPFRVPGMFATLPSP